MARKLRTIDVGSFTLMELPDRRWKIVIPGFPSLIVPANISGLHEAFLQMRRLNFVAADQDTEQLYQALREHGVIALNGQLAESPVYYKLEHSRPWLGEIDNLELLLRVGNTCRSWQFDRPLRLGMLHEPANWASNAINREVPPGKLTLRLMGVTKALGVFQSVSSHIRSMALATSD